MTTTRLTILQTADLHGQLETHDEFYLEDGRPTYRRAGGVARIRTLFDRVRAENPNTIIVDNGDCFQGSGWTQLTRGQAMVPVMNALGYDVLMPGNWEVVFGKDRLLEVGEQYDCTMVCTNMHHAEPGEGESQPLGNDVVGNHLFSPFTVVERDGVRVGILAYNDPNLTTRQAPAYSRGIAMTRPAQSLAHWVRHLREDEGCRVVLVMGHLGLAPQVALADQDFTEGVDYILGGDTHERVRQPLQGRFARVTEPGAFGSFVGRLDLEVGDDGVHEVGYELLDVPADLPEDGEVRAVVDKLREDHPELSEQIGTTASVLQRYYVLESPMDNLITDALFARASAALEAGGGTLDIALSNGFRFCPPLVPGDGGSAVIDRQFLWSMLPENAEVKVGTVTGAQIRTWLEKELNNVFSPRADEVFGGWVVRFAGMRVRFVSEAPMGRRLRSVEVGGRPLDPEDAYVVAACERDGDPPTTLCRLRNVADPRLLGFTLHDALGEFLADGEVTYALEGRCVAEDLPGRFLGQKHIEGYEFR